MLRSVQRNNNIIKFDDESESQSEDNQYLMKKDQYKIQRENPQKEKNVFSQKQPKEYVSVVRQNQFSRIQSHQNIIKYQSIRRNKSFKVKKDLQDANKSKISYNKSVAKITNIFQEAEEIELRSSNKFAVHNQSEGEQNKKQQMTVNVNQFKSNALNVNKKMKSPPLLKLSNITQSLNKEDKKIKTQSEKFGSSDFFDKAMRKTAYTQKPMKQLLDRKLSTRTTVRPISSKTQQSKEIKVRYRIQQIFDFSNFSHKKIPKAHVLSAKIKKDSSGFNFLWPEFHMHDMKTNMHLLSAKKKAANTTSNYYISRNQKQIDVQNTDYMGKVRSNFIGSCFNIFNQGVNPENLNKNKNENNYRILLASVIYESQIANANPKAMRVYFIKPPYNYYDLEGTNIKEEQSNLQDLYQIGSNKDKISVFKNRKPIYNKKQNKFVLNFDGRIKRPSTKNFILEDSQTHKQVMMFGKVQDEQYCLYVSSPLTPHIGLGIALAQLDSKIICD